MRRHHAFSEIAISIPNEIKSCLRASAFLKCKPIIPASLAASTFVILKNERSLVCKNSRESHLVFFILFIISLDHSLLDYFSCRLNQEKKYSGSCSSEWHYTVAEHEVRLPHREWIYSRRQIGVAISPNTLSSGWWNLSKNVEMKLLYFIQMHVQPVANLVKWLSEALI